MRGLTRGRYAYAPMQRSSFAILAVFAAAAQSMGQGAEYRLDAPGSWRAVETRPLTPDEQLIARARQAMAEGRPGVAKSLLTPWIEKYETTEHPLLPQALMLRGDARVADGDEHKALYDYEAIAMGFPATEEYRRAVERELEIGIKYLYGLKARWFGVRWRDATDTGEELLIRVQERLPQSEVAERAAIELADYYFRVRDLEQAEEMYEIFLVNFPRSRYAAHARERRISSNVARFKGPEYDATGLLDAKVLIKEFADRDPAAAQRANVEGLIARIDESAAQQMLDKALWYDKRDDPVGMRHSLRRLMAKQPNTVAARTALQILEERGWTPASPTPASKPEPAEAAP